MVSFTKPLLFQVIDLSIKQKGVYLKVYDLSFLPLAIEV